MSEQNTIDTGKSLRRYIIFGFIVMIVFIGAFVAWTVFSQISGAVIASGQTVVETYSKSVQHREGGIVAEIKVKDGQRVEAGSLLIRLDETEAKAQLGIIDAVLVEALAQRARLHAQRDNEAEIEFPDELLNSKFQADVTEAIDGQRKLFETTRVAMKGRREQLHERIGQLHDEIEGLQAQIVSRDNQQKLIAHELGNMKKLQEKGLVQASRVLALEREQERISGEGGRLQADVARANGRIGETKLQIIQLDDDERNKTLTELREAEGRIAEYRERRLASEANVRRTEIRAPRTGVVHGLIAHTIGQVIAPGETIMKIVPETDRLIIQAQVRPQDRDQIEAQQKTIVRFPGLDDRVTPQLNGNVIDISADLVEPGNNLPPYYDVRVEVDKDELKTLIDKLKPGMPAEVYMQTGARSPLNYLLQPLTDQFNRTFKER